MKIYQSPTFFKFIKRVDKKFKAEIDSQVKLIAEKPEIGDDLPRQNVTIFKHNF